MATYEQLETLYIIKSDNGMYLENWSKMQGYSDKIASILWTKHKDFACTFCADAAVNFINRYGLIGVSVEMANI